ncbi:MAG TPA: Spy/CpxP family protein refolding chaperone [Gemmatimonadaceae bacterium]
MTRINSTLLALAIVAGAAATAGAQQTTAPAQGQRIERTERDSARAWKREGRGPRGEGRGMHGAGALMRGVNLTDAQKAQVKAIHQKYQDQFKSIREANKPAMEEARAARQRGDTAAARAAFEKGRTQFESLRQQELNEVRGVLTADQQKTFDANLQQLKARQEQHGRRGGRSAK